VRSDGTKPQSPPADKPLARWSLYVVRTHTGALYTGISTDVEQRCARHSSGRGAKALRGRGPFELVYQVALGDRLLALRAECALKRLTKRAKETLVCDAPGPEYWSALCAPPPSSS